MVSAADILLRSCWDRRSRRRILHLSPGNSAGEGHLQTERTSVCYTAQQANTRVYKVSGRRRFNVVGPKSEEYFAKQTYQIVMSAYRQRILPPQHPQARMVQRVAARLISAAGLASQRWEVHVIDAPIANAFVIPGGKIFVFTGILSYCQSEAAVAAILGHELAHDIAHHSAEKMSRNYIVFASVLLAEILLNLRNGNLTYRMSDWLINLPGSRKVEVGFMATSTG